MKNIRGLSIEELKTVLKNWGYPDFRARQIFKWVHKIGINDFARMDDLPVELREKTKEGFTVGSIRIKEEFCSADRTKKLLFVLKDNSLVEGVSIPAKERVTGCISTQVGCKFACSFCASGLSGFKRDLSTAEIVEEALCIKQASGNKLTHLVFMGTGEPLDNYDNVIKAIRILNSPEGLHIGARRITVSTSGIIPGIERLAGEGLQIELSVSLHSADDVIRSRIMPVNKKYPLLKLIDACRKYIRGTNRQITFEYILIKGLNSGLADREKMVKLLRGLNCKINLIPLNYVQGLNMCRPSRKEVMGFRDYLLKHYIRVTLRQPRGEDISAACGQLRLKYAEV